MAISFQIENIEHLYNYGQLLSIQWRGGGRITPQKRELMRHHIRHMIETIHSFHENDCEDQPQPHKDIFKACIEVLRYGHQWTCSIRPPCGKTKKCNGITIFDVWNSLPADEMAKSLPDDEQDGYAEYYSVRGRKVNKKPSVNKQLWRWRSNEPFYKMAREVRKDIPEQWRYIARELDRQYEAQFHDKDIVKLKDLTYEEWMEIHTKLKA